MTDNEKNKFTVDMIQKIFESESIRIAEILWYGSRATRTYTADSDWDYLIITDDYLNHQHIRNLKKKIRRKPAESFIIADLIVKSKHDYELYKSNAGHITYYAAKFVQKTNIHSDNVR
jgi:predicted nucleotidyltransferase